ncbi:MAG: gas vesicle protein K [Dehalococcoidia bacterium]|nr:gas vesicle protein K [Dehalococcoidia bacterium]
MIVDLDEKDLKSGVLGLVVALVEIIKETLRLQALRRMESGSLTLAEVERLGVALMDLDAAIEKLKVEMGITESVKAVRDGLDSVVDDLLDTMLNPERWAHEAHQVLKHGAN